MIYAVYDKATLRVVKSGIASAEDCESQIDDLSTQAVVSAASDEEMDSAKSELGLR